MKKYFYKVVFCAFCVLTFFVSNSFSNYKEDTAQEYLNKAYKSNRDGKVYEALRDYSKSIALGGQGSPENYNDMGMLFEKSQIFDKAEKAYLKAIEIDPRYLPPYTNLGFFYKSKGENQLALDFFCKRFLKAALNDEWNPKIEKEILELDPGKKNWVESVKANKYSQKISARKEFRNNIMSYDPLYLYSKGISFYAEKDFETAYLAFKLASIKDPKTKKYELAAFDAHEKLPVQSQYYMADVVFQDKGPVASSTHKDDLNVWMSQPTVWKDPAIK